MIKAVSKQLRYLEQIIFAGFTHQPAITLAENLIKVLPGNMQKIFFSDNGSTATEVAVKMSIQYWYNKNIHKKTIVAFEGAYHGDTFGAMSVGARDGFNKPFESYLFDVQFLPIPNEQNIDQILEKIDILVKQGVAAFIYEPLVQGSAGMRMYSPQHLNSILAKFKEYETILIADEVFTGFGRTGKLFASEYVETKPDIICLSKALTGGYLPLGATACNSKIVSAFSNKHISTTFLHGHSYTGNALACAAAVESFRLLQSKASAKQRIFIEEKFSNWTSTLQNHPKIKEIRHLGCIFAIELKSELQSGYQNPIREILYDLFLQKNILVRPLGNVIYILPPYIIQEKELNYIYNTIQEVLNELQ
jgi:adenosylmethionine-8-amino-7-oxononanoate aminotransferase